MGREQIKLYVILFKTVFSRYKFRIAVLTLVGFVNGIFDAVSVTLLIPLFSLVVKKSGGDQDVVSQWVSAFFDFLGVSMNITALLVLMTSLFIGKAIAEFLLSYIRVHISTAYQNDARIDLYRKTLHARWPYLLNQKLGYLESVIMTDVGATMSMLKQITQIAPNSATFLVYLVAAFKISWVITLLTLGVGLLLLVATRPFIMRTKRYAIRAVNINKIIAHRVNESVMGMKTIKASGIDEAVIRREKKIWDELRGLLIKSSIVKGIGASITEPVIFIFLALIFAFSYKHTEFNFASFVVVIYLVQRIFNSVRKTQGTMHVLQESLAFAHHVVDLGTSAVANKEESEANDAFVFNDMIEFRNVSFAYESGGPVLHDVSFRLKKNEMIGIIGPSGVGKTTIADMVLRLFTPTKGDILIDGKDINRIALHDYRRHIGYVSQDIFLMNDTIETNIKFYDESVNDEAMMKAAHDANIYDFIMGLPKKFKTIIGEHGVLLSGGQRQRIILARALASHPALLILDEATSSLDNESEALIRQSIENLKGGMTVLVIAHRLSTIMRLDRLIVLEGGRVMEQGTPHELLKHTDSYFTKVFNIGERNNDLAV